jgi:hypothetical protein
VDIEECTIKEKTLEIYCRVAGYGLDLSSLVQGAVTDCFEHYNGKCDILLTVYYYVSQ